jgi:hypothetical protein
MPWRAITSLGRYCVVSVTTATPIAAAPHYSPVRRVSGGAPELSNVAGADVVGSDRGEGRRERPEMEGAVKYMAIIFNDESAYANATPEEIGAIFAAHGEFGEAAGKAGVLQGGDGLQPTATATTVRVRDGERLLTDGPYAETKEQLGGFYMLECKDLDEALAWAARIPEAKTGAIEVRPVMVYDEMEAEGTASEATAS